MTLTIEKINGEIQVVPNVKNMRVNADILTYKRGASEHILQVNTIANISMDMSLEEVAQRLYEL